MNSLSELRIKLIGIVYSDVKREYFPTEEAYITEKDSLDDAKIIEGYIKKLGFETKLYPGNPELPVRLKQDKPDMVVNLVGSVRGQDYLASTIPALLELLEIPYTGAGILGEALAYNKFVVKKLLEQNGVPVPNYQLFNTPAEPLSPMLRFPLISKLNEIHGGVEIDINSISETEKHLRERLKFLINTYNQPVLVEEFIVGREITGHLLEGLNKKVYMAEKVFRKTKRKYLFVTFQDNWLEHDKAPFRYQKFQDPILKAYILKAFEVTKMSDMGKFDVRMDSSGRYFFIDCNSNPAFGPEECGTSQSSVLALYGIGFNEVLRRLIINTMSTPSTPLAG